MWECDGLRSWTFGDLREAAERLPSIERGGFAIVEGTGPEFVLGTLRAWRDDAVLVPCEPGQRDSVPVRKMPKGICHLKQTSGSTGHPRAVAFTAPQLAADANHIVATMGLRADWPNLSVLSLAHSYGFSNLVLPLLLHGVPLAFVNDALPGTVASALEGMGPVTLAAVPAMWRAWQRVGVLSSQIEIAISAGAPLTLALERDAFEAAGVKIHNFYGSTECGGIAYDRSKVPRDRPTYVGTAMDGVALSVEEGCLRVASPAVADGYLDACADGMLGGGFFQTQDRAEMDGEGKVFLIGREGEWINVAGRKLAPSVLEEHIQPHENVHHVLVFGVPSKDVDRVDDVIAVVSLVDHSLWDGTRAALMARLPAWQRPRDWWLCESLKPDARGKLSRARWRARYLQERAN